MISPPSGKNTGPWAPLCDEIRDGVCKLVQSALDHHTYGTAHAEVRTIIEEVRPDVMLIITIDLVSAKLKDKGETASDPTLQP